MRVLQLSTHTTLIPRHGGKLRSHHIGRVLHQNGFLLQRLAFCHRSPDDIEDSNEPIIDVGRSPYWRSCEFEQLGSWKQYLYDYLSTVAALQTPSLLAEFDNYILNMAPDLVLLEHPWTWPLLSRYNAVSSGAMRVIYSSQNVEADLKRRILLNEGVSLPTDVLKSVEGLERDLVQKSAGVAACTVSDANVFASWGCARVVVAPNGGVFRARDHLVHILPRPLEPQHSYALVVGSAHPPNISGFVELVAPTLSSLRPLERIVIAGSAGPAIISELQSRGLGTMLDDRLVSLGVVDELYLDCLIANCKVLLLPILYGGGSNVKTAEALLSGRPVIASEAAMRGFDEFRLTPGLTVAADVQCFGEALLDLLAAPFQAGVAAAETRSGLLWDETIRPLVDLLHELDSRCKPTGIALPSNPGP